MRGLILAAGECSRMPAKYFLPVNGVPIIDWQIKQLEDAGCTETTVVVQHDSLIDLYLQNRPVSIVYQNGFNGPWSAIDAGITDDPTIILACDNVTKVMPDFRRYKTVVTMRDVPEWMKKHLHTYDLGQWVRGGMGLALTYPLYTWESWEKSRSLFEQKIEFTLGPWKDWFDIGTEETYRCYLNTR
jgi:hypothetical protein